MTVGAIFGSHVAMLVFPSDIRRGNPSVLVTSLVINRTYGHVTFLFGPNWTNNGHLGLTKCLRELDSLKGYLHGEIRTGAYALCYKTSCES